MPADTALSAQFDFGALANSASLNEWLNRTCRVQTGRRIVAGVSSGDSQALAMLGGTAQTTHASARFLCGCIAKALTAALVWQLVADGKFDLETPVTDLLDPGPVGEWPLLKRIAVRHLLNHTHGLDASSFHIVPYTSDGRIDLRALYRAISRTGRLAEPGEIYSYGSCGSWLAAAILERQLGQPYDEILLSRLLQPLGIQPERDTCYSGRFCPARGGALRITVTELLAYLGWEISRHDCASVREAMSAASVPLPGHGMERGAALGWLSYGEGWLGHTALLPNASICVRFHPARRIAIAVATDSRSAALVLARMFGQALPEFRDYSVPRPLPRWDAAAWDADQYAGTYQNGAVTATVSRAFPPVLEIANQEDIAFEGLPSPMSSRLQASAQGVFLLDPPAAAYGQWCQFIGRSHRGYQYLWNGKELLRRRS